MGKKIFYVVKLILITFELKLSHKTELFLYVREIDYKKILIYLTDVLQI
jgi:hypothetical protein